ncbi:very short patch repair endonuclease [Diaphorobacter ruginosibacter]|uniref:Very short patch repair endonuclease n=1 Tax=Diaphorobacter ruginosibacter TaxID=1715720 RepID=A0A7G9RIY3_9BURK|nr:very short patch repair endonuclease [Diaphorobacter ruginosibacter]QNN55558.1 very short patch repair endonuclease [Diaphorobacter ruginosibacter]
MADVFDKIKRSEVMGLIRGRNNKSTEIRLAAAFKSARVSGWRRQVQLKPWSVESGLAEGKKIRVLIRPDFIFRAPKVAVFVDGCFWHGCPRHSKMPKTNAAFWREKLSKNIIRDERANKALEAAGWTVIRIWEHEMAEPSIVVERVTQVLAKHMAPLCGTSPHETSPADTERS